MTDWLTDFECESMLKCLKAFQRIKIHIDWKRDKKSFDY